MKWFSIERLIIGFITKEVFFSLWSLTPKIVTVSPGRSSPLPYLPLPPHPAPSSHHCHLSRGEAPPQPSRTAVPRSAYRRPATKEQNEWEGRPTTSSTDRALPSIDEARGWSDTASP